MFLKSLAAVASLITGALGAGLSLDAHHGLDSRDEPCRQVRDQAVKWMSDNGIVPKNSTERPLYMPATPAVPIRPSLAFACLKSVPLMDRDSALRHIDFLRTLFEWQSSVAYLRDPPQQGYLSEGVDLPGGLDDIAAKLNKDEADGGYANEFEFLADLRTLSSVRPRDNIHFASPTLLLDLFDFPMTAQFISISDDGLTIPKVYLYDDIKHTHTPSPVSTIDGIPALEFLQKASIHNGFSHDPDARFNSVFRSLAVDANLAYHTFPDLFGLSLRDTTEVKCLNGTKFEFTNTALLRANFTKIASGADLYDVYGRGNATDEPPLISRFYKLAERNYTTTFTGYPKAFKAATETGNIVGFLPESPEFSDVAVLAVNSFSEVQTPASDQGNRDLGVQYREFYQVTVDLISAAKAANRTKLVLDLQGNGGGFFHNVLVLYFALFPSDTLPLLWQSRAHPQLAWLGKHLWNVTGKPPFPLSNLIKPDGKPWSSFEEVYGPFPDDPDGQRWGEHTHPAMANTTAILRDFTDMFPLPDGWEYQNPWTTPPFRPEDIIIVTDGQCGSGCAITVSTLTHAHGVRTVALGGRPLHAPMQAIGQIKGGPAAAFALMPQFDRAQVPHGLELPPDSFTYRPPLRIGGSQGADYWGGSVMINAGEMLPYKGNACASDLGQGEVPLQFRYEAANCRLFYTWDMAQDITAVWKAAAAVAWRGGKCVPGSTTNSDGTMGADVPGYSKLVEDQYRLGNGAGAVREK